MSTVRKLKELIKDLPDDTPLISPGPDHSYHDVYPHVSTALNERGGYYGNWTEDHGEDLTPESEYGERKTVVIFD